MIKRTIFILLSFTLPVWAFTDEKTDSVKKADEMIREKGKKYGVQNVLVVLDVDSTLLTPYSDLGSSFWSSWQMGMLKTPEVEPEQVATSLDGFYQIVDVIRS